MRHRPATSLALFRLSLVTPVAITALLALLALFAGRGTAHSATLADVTLPDKADVDGQSLVLDGLGLRTKFFVKVYVGGLYLTHKEHDAAKVLAEDSPRRMVLSFLYSVKSGQMCDAWKEGLADNSPRAAAEVKNNFNSLCGYMEDIPKGQTLTLTYVPGQGTEVAINGKVKGKLLGKPTSDAILATWIGPKPGPGDDFKKAVLGKP